MAQDRAATQQDRIKMKSIKQIVLGPDGKLRFIWRATLFYAVPTWLLFPLTDRQLERLAGPLHVRPGLNAGSIALEDALTLVIVLIVTGAFALYERRRVDSYGLAANRAFSLQTFEGAAVGVASAAVVAIGMIALGGMQIQGLATTGSALALSALAWLGANILIGLTEEFWFRSYFQQTLWKSIGFWPASIVIALIFTAEHYFFKQGENIWDVITLMSLSLLMSYTMLRTGTLWFAVGFHAAYDYMQLFIIGTPNGSQLPEGRLLNVSFNGPTWLTGGVLGTEASFLMYPVIALLWLYVWGRYRKNPPLQL
jgi:uncharacterized protein